MTQLLPDQTRPATRRRWPLYVAALAGLLIAILVAASVWFRSLDTVPFAPDRARDGLDLGDAPDIPAGMRSFLLVGSDSRGTDVGRADVLMLVVMRPDGKAPVLASVPRDLWVDNPCTGGQSRVNAGLAGCGERATGPELLSLMIEELSGVAVQHYVQVDFAGFVDTVAQLGGVEICTDLPVRDVKSGLDLPGGCVDASAEQTLAWVRSRSTQELTASGWRTMGGVSDLTRNERQQDVLLQLASRALGARSPGELTTLARGVEDNFVLGEGLRVTDGVSLAWNLRGVDLSEADRVTIPVTPWTTPGGAAVLLPDEPLSDLLAPLVTSD